MVSIPLTQKEIKCLKELVAMAIETSGENCTRMETLGGPAPEAREHWKWLQRLAGKLQYYGASTAAEPTTATSTASSTATTAGNSSRIAPETSGQLELPMEED